MKKQKSKAPTGARCTSTVSGGVLKCVLEGEHEVHSTATAGRNRKGQYATWSTIEDGRIQVITYSGGKRQSEWFEQAPAAQLTPCPEEDARGLACSKVAGHDGEHSNARGWEPKVAQSAEEAEPERASNWWAEWERIGKPEIDVRTVPCPTCKATKGYCKRPSGHKAMNAHAARWDAALLKAVRAYEEKHCGGCGVPRDQPHAETCPSPLAALNRKPTKAPAASDEEPAAKPESVEDRVYAMIVAEPGRTAPQIGRRYSKAIAKLEADGRIEWRDEGWWPVVSASPAPMTLKDEPEDPEADAAALDVAETTHLGYSGSIAHVPEIDDEPEEPPERDWAEERATLADDEDDPLEDDIRSDEERDLARKMREDREAHARELENDSVDDGKRGSGQPAPHEMQQGAATPGQSASSAAGNVAEPHDAPTGHRSIGPSSTSKILGYRRHPAAALFPLLEGEAFERFADRIQASGLRDPIVRVTVGGETFILDGSNRALACERRNVPPRFVDYEGPKDIASLVAYSIDKNGDGRRHLDPSVRAMIALEAATLGRGNPGKRETGGAAGLTQAEAGKRLGVGERLVRKAKVVRDKGTAKVRAAVMAGKLSVEAAEVVTKLPQAKQDEIAEEALAKSTAIKSGRVRALVKQEEKRAIVRKINEQRVAPMPVGEFGVIYGDYPWLYDNSDQHDGSRGHLTYPPMTMDAILAHAREAAKRAAKDCIVALWTTNLHVVNGNVARVVEAYGATPHSMFTWPKQRPGVGTWGRGQTEHLVIASIGSPVHTLNEVSTLLPSWKPEHPGEHSSKPAEVAELLRKHCAGPFLELFGRGPREGFVVWGAEVDKFAAEAA